MNSEIKQQLEKYMKANGLYDTKQIRIDEGMDDQSARFMDIFGGFDKDTPEQQSELLAAAEAYNDEILQKMHNAELLETAQQMEVAIKTILTDNSEIWAHGTQAEQRAVIVDKVAAQGYLIRNHLAYKNGDCLEFNTGQIEEIRQEVKAVFGGSVDSVIKRVVIFSGNAQLQVLEPWGDEEMAGYDIWVSTELTGDFYEYTWATRKEDAIRAGRKLLGTILDTENHTIVPVDINPIPAKMLTHLRITDKED